MSKKPVGGRVVTEPYKSVTVAEFLGLPEWYVHIWDSLNALRKLVKVRRTAAGLTQAQLGKRMASTQTVVARIEGDFQGVGFDITMRALYALGISRAEVAAAIAGEAAGPDPVIPAKRLVTAIGRPSRRAPAKRPTPKRPTAKVVA